MTEYVGFDASAGFTNEKLQRNMECLTFGGRLKGSFYWSGTVDPTGLDADNGATSQITVPGVNLGDAVAFVSCAVDLQDLTVTGYIQAANTVELRFGNVSLDNSRDLASTTFYVGIWDFT